MSVLDIGSSNDLLSKVLSEQQSTAIDRFSDWHTRQAETTNEQVYRDLIPLSTPAPGEQYAFEVDLDACSGCKSCVVACHNLNGLEEDELWRSVGLIHGGSRQLPVLQHVTSACHHCLAPACLDGCPVEAYEKDPITGIVRHLDDQCIGCQYCILKCPYDVPKYSHSKGIVRKCDMCRQRLAVGEAPACVQSCPNGAIRITIVNRQDIAENAEANLFLPGAPEPGYTLPTTVYKSNRPLPTNLLPADYYSAAPQRAHWPLIFMLVLTQMSVGAFAVEQVFGRLNSAGALGDSAGAGALRYWSALGLGFIGLFASVFHLGRPFRAYRAIMGWRTSWLSREVIAFGAFAAFASTYSAIPLLTANHFPVAPWLTRLVGDLVAVTGLLGVLCSTMIYASTKRALWHPVHTGLKFLLTSCLLGIPVSILTRLIAAAISGDPASGSTPSLFMNGQGRLLCECLIGITAAKLAVDAAIFACLSGLTITSLRRTAMLMVGELHQFTVARFALGLVGGILLPLVLIATDLRPDALVFPIALGALIAVLCFAGETLERYLFFAAVVAPKMPGAPAS